MKRLKIFHFPSKKPYFKKLKRIHKTLQTDALVSKDKDRAITKNFNRN